MPEAQHNKPDPEAQQSDAPAAAGGDTPDTPPATDDNPPQKKGNGAFASLLALLALIIAIGALIVGYDRLQGIGLQQAQQGERLDALESGAGEARKIAQQAQQQNQDTQAQLDTLNGEFSGLAQQLDELQQTDNNLRAAVEKIQDTVRAGRDDDFLAAEARHLMRIAQHQARLNHRPAAAAAALEAANQRLSDAADPALLDVRKALTDDIIALRSVAELDISGIALTLSQLQQAIETLPLKQQFDEVPPPPADEVEATPAEGIGGFFSRIWSDLKGLVTLRRHSSQETALLPPGQRFFLQQNLRLQLEAARLALLQRDTQSFHNSLATTEQWLNRYFDTTAPATANMLTALSPYHALALQPALPDIGGSLRALEAWREQRNGTAGKGSAS